MSKNPIRKDKTCLNCRYVVENRFCPNCGQENTDTRKTFHHLFIHFFEDLTHYENAFWKTIKNLLLRPSSLTKEYLSGKRLSYLAPVRLYIFISFVTFFLVSAIPNNEDEDFIKETNKKGEKETVVGNKYVKLSSKDSIDDTELTKNEIKAINSILNAKYIPEDAKDSIIDAIKTSRELKNEKDDSFMNFGYSTIKELDSVRKVNPKEVNDIEYWLSKKIIPLNEKYSNNEIIEKLVESANHNFPKVLLLYMPLFAFFLWLFHNKKRWYYFDHGIFTLHYFSFLLLIYLVLYLLTKIISLFIENTFTNFLDGAIHFIGYVWMFYYFFPAHHRFFGETRVISFIKSSILFFINMIFICIILLLFFLYTLINIH